MRMSSFRSYFLPSGFARVWNHPSFKRTWPIPLDTRTPSLTIYLTTPGGNCHFPRRLMLRFLASEPVGRRSYQERPFPRRTGNRPLASRATCRLPPPRDPIMPPRALRGAEIVPLLHGEWRIRRSTSLASLRSHHESPWRTIRCNQRVAGIAATPDVHVRVVRLFARS